MSTPARAPLATVTLGSSASSVTFSSIPATYRDLVVVIEGGSSGTVVQLIYFNNDTGANYSSVRMFGNGSTAGSEAVSSPRIGNSYSSSTLTKVQIMDYSATDKHKTYLARNDRAASIVIAEAGRWANTSAITSVKVQPTTGTYNSGTTVNLYGVIA